MTKLEQILEEVSNKINQPLIDARFGDNWKDSLSTENLSREHLIEIAWKQGRRAILLERELEKIIKQLNNK